jgi:phage-related protein
MRQQTSRGEDADRFRGEPAWLKSSATIAATQFRAVYTVRHAGAVYMLHAFQKKAKPDRETPRRDLELIQQRLREAERIRAEEQR